MSAHAEAVHAFVCELRATINSAPNKHGLTGDEVFAGIMQVLCESIAKTREPVRSMIVETVREVVAAAVAYEAGNTAAFLHVLNPEGRA